MAKIVDYLRGMEHYTRINSNGTLKGTYEQERVGLKVVYEFDGSEFTYYFYSGKLAKIEIWDGEFLNEIYVK